MRICFTPFSPKLFVPALQDLWTFGVKEYKFLNAKVNFSNQKRVEDKRVNIGILSFLNKGIIIHRNTKMNSRLVPVTFYTKVVLFLLKAR